MKHQLRGLVRKYLEPLGILSQDKIGSVICQKNGSLESSSCYARWAHG